MNGTNQMIEKPRIVETESLIIAEIPLLVPISEVQTVMGPGVMELMAVIADQGITAVGPWFTHHRRKPAETFDFSICIPVEKPVIESGRVKPGELSAVTVARTVYQGGYEGLAAAWGEFHEWLDGEGHSPAPNLWECYAVGPETGSDPAKWRTELNQPLV